MPGPIANSINSIKDIVNQIPGASIVHDAVLNIPGANLINGVVTGSAFMGGDMKMGEGIANMDLMAGIPNLGILRSQDGARLGLQGLLGSPFGGSFDGSIMNNMTAPINDAVSQVASSITNILIMNLKLPAEVAQLLLSPLMSLSSLASYDGILAPDLKIMLTERNLLESFNRMGEGELDLIMNSLSEVRALFPSLRMPADGNTSFPIISRQIDFVRKFKQEAIGIIFQGEGKKINLLESLIPDALLRMFSFQDVQLNLMSELKSIFDKDFSTRDIVDILNRMPATGIISSIVDKDMPILDSFLGKKNPIASDSGVSISHGFAPLSDVASGLIEIAKESSQMLIGLSTAIPAFTIKTGLGFVTLSKNCLVDVLSAKNSVLKIMVNMPLDISQSLLDSKLWDILNFNSLEEVPQDLLAESPFDISLFPGGFSNLRMIIGDMGKFIDAYNSYILALGYEAALLPFEVFAQMASEILNIIPTDMPIVDFPPVCEGDQCPISP